MRIWVIEYQSANGQWNPYLMGREFDEYAASRLARSWSDENNNYRAVPYVREEKLNG